MEGGGYSSTFLFCTSKKSFVTNSFCIQQMQFRDIITILYPRGPPFIKYTQCPFRVIVCLLRYHIFNSSSETGVGKSYMAHRCWIFFGFTRFMKNIVSFQVKVTINSFLIIKIHGLRDGHFLQIRTLDIWSHLRYYVVFNLLLCIGQVNIVLNISKNLGQNDVFSVRL